MNEINIVLINKNKLVKKMKQRRFVAFIPLNDQHTRSAIAKVKTKNQEGYKGNVHSDMLEIKVKISKFSMNKNF